MWQGIYKCFLVKFLNFIPWVFSAIRGVVAHCTNVGLEVSLVPHGSDQVLLPDDRRATEVQSQ